MWVRFPQGVPAASRRCQFRAHNSASDLLCLFTPGLQGYSLFKISCRRAAAVNSGRTTVRPIYYVCLRPVLKGIHCLKSAVGEPHWIVRAGKIVRIFFCLILRYFTFLKCRIVLRKPCLQFCRHGFSVKM